MARHACCPREVVSWHAVEACLSVRACAAALGARTALSLVQIEAATARVAATADACLAVRRARAKGAVVCYVVSIHNVLAPAILLTAADSLTGEELGGVASSVQFEGAGAADDAHPVGDIPTAGVSHSRVGRGAHPVVRILCASGAPRAVVRPAYRKPTL